MTTVTLPAPPSRVELELMLRAAVLEASPQEHGRQQAGRVTRSLVRSLCALAGAVGVYDLALLLNLA